jgi:ABC-type molybdate transport system substrate-binding protein
MRDRSKILTNYREDVMRTNRLVSVSTLAFLFILGTSSAADAAEIQVLCSVGLKAVMDDLAPQFERVSTVAV